MNEEKTKVYIGIDVGSVSCNIAAIDLEENILFTSTKRTVGKPIQRVQELLSDLKLQLPDIEVAGVCTTGSARNIIAKILNADFVKNEITTHAMASIKENPEVRTVIEIGGQDSKLILIEEGVVTDFAMNTVCAAGTGSFLDQQAARLGLSVFELGDLALRSTQKTNIAGRCAVFAESDMIHKQQIGVKTEDIVRGVCDALVRNYLNNLAKGKKFNLPVMFQGGVAANKGIIKAFEDALNLTIHVPKNHDSMGAIGSALYAKRNQDDPSKFRGLGILEQEFECIPSVCKDCMNSCELVKLKNKDEIVGVLGSRCGKW